MVPSSPADGDAIKASKFYGRSLPRPTIIGDQQLPASDIAKAQEDRVGFIPVTQPLLGPFPTRCAAHLPAELVA